MLVRIRKDAQHTFAYFIDSRRMVGTNEVGGIVLDLILNQHASIEEVAKIVSSEYDVPEMNARDDAVAFLASVEDELGLGKFNSSDQVQMDTPLGVELEITRACNLRCRHCFQTDYADIYMPKERAFQILDTLAVAGVCEVSVIGGEPLVHPGYREILKRCELHEFAIDLVTNGLLIDDAAAEWLARVQRLSIFVSVDGVESRHDAIRGKGTFRKVDAAIRRLLNQRADPEVIVTLNAINASDYRSVLEYCRALGITCNFNLFKPLKPQQQSLILNPDVFFDIIVDLFQLRQSGYFKIGIANAAIVSKLLYGYSYNECRATQSGLVIDTEGRMLTCPALVAAGHYRSEQLPFFSEDFVKTWHEHEIFTRFRSDGLRGCQARSLICCGDTVAPDPYGIEAFNKYLESHSAP